MSLSRLRITTQHDPTIYEYYLIKQKLKTLRPYLIELSSVGKETVNLLRKIRKDLQNELAGSTDEKVGGSVIAMVGGALSAVGFGLSFVTVGASLGISIAGTAIAGLGSGVVALSSVGDLSSSIKSKAKAQEAINKYRKLLMEVSKACLEIGDHLHSQADSDIWKDFWEHLLLGYKGVKAMKHIYWDMIAKTIRDSLRLGGYFVDDAISAGAKVTGTVFRTLGTTGKVLHITGGVAGILFIPLDVYNIVSLSNNVDKEQHNDATDLIEKWASEIEVSCPEESEIDAMIQGTIKELWQRCFNQEEGTMI